MLHKNIKDGCNFKMTERKEALDILAEQTEREKQEEALNQVKEILKKVYPKIIAVLKTYCDLDEKYYNIIVLWIIGTWLHNIFSTYPYLFFNAMKGSGKTRTLKLIASLSKNGKVVVSVSEAVLFRTAKGRTICIDECERIASKDKQALRELLNVAYKDGLAVERAKKVTHIEGENYVIERFDLFVPIALANIYGLEDVLSDRCISFIIEKSEKRAITRLLEDFDTNLEIREINELFSVVLPLLSFKSQKTYIYNATSYWNSYIKRHYVTNDTNGNNGKTAKDEKIISENNNNDTNNTTQNNIYNKVTIFDDLFSKIKGTTLNGRHLELFFPLFIIADFCGEEILQETIETAEKIVQEQKVEDVMESRDVSLIYYVAEHITNTGFIVMKDLLRDFKEYLDLEEEESKWTNAKWLGRALKRLGLIIDKRRLGTKGKSREVRLDYKKAIDKIIIFKTEVKKAGVEEEAQDIYKYAKDSKSETLINADKVDIQEQKDGIIKAVQEKIIDDGENGEK